MNTYTAEEHLENWERDLHTTKSEPTIPEEDKARVLHELDELYSMAYDHLLKIGYTPECIQEKLDSKADV